MTIGTRKDGDFCWINMLTPEPERARAFFGTVLGWTYDDIPGMGHLVQVDGRNIGGLFDLAGPNTPPGTPPHIGIMVKVASADETAERVKALGGQSPAVFDVMTSGRMAVCIDPTGVRFDLWQPLERAGTDADSLHHDTPSWFEARTNDVARATVFYSELFGWSSDTMDMPTGKYTVFRLGDESIAGMVGLSPEMGATAAEWAVHFTVRDADAAVRDAASAGGTIRMPVYDIPGVGRGAGIASPQGVTFHVIEYRG